MAHCENCGTRISNGLCPNCHEEAFIVETQGEFLPDDLSEEFLCKVVEQREAAQRTRRPARPLSPEGTADAE